VTKWFDRIFFRNRKFRWNLPLQKERFFLKILFPESQGIICHGIDDGKRFQANAHVTDLLSALLEAFLDYDSSTLKSGSGFLHNVDQAKKSAAIGKKIVDQKYMILRS